MVKRAAAFLALGVALGAAAFADAQAQALQRLTVQSFVLSSDTATPRVEVPFHLILTLRVRERISAVENLNLPLLAQLDLLGDERETMSGPHGTQYRETITVIAHDPGTIAVAPATLQAIDARDGKPKEWYTNGLTLQIAGPGVQHVFATGAQAFFGAALAALRLLLWLLLWALGIGCLALILVLLFRRRRRPIAPVPVQRVAAPVPVERSRREQAEDALAVLSAERTRRAAITARGAIWRMVGATDGETLGDVLRRPETSEMVTRNLLVALERSAFTYDEDLRPAIDDACAALERYIESEVSS
jgi:hypothetical protein